jgi:hypothetical protein
MRFRIIQTLRRAERTTEMTNVISAAHYCRLHMPFCDASVAIYIFCNEARGAMRRNPRVRTADPAGG